CTTHGLYTRCNVIIMCLCSLFFFSSRRRHTRCYRDWSSDVCSSDLLLIDRDANDTAAEYARARIREVVDDPELAERLSPRNHPRSEERRVGKEGRSRWWAGA